MDLGGRWKPWPWPVEASATSPLEAADLAPPCEACLFAERHEAAIVYVPSWRPGYAEAKESELTLEPRVVAHARGCRVRLARDSEG